MKRSKVTLITTVFNEEQSIGAFIDSIFSQTLVPDEIIIVDGGSSDKTLVRVKEKMSLYKNQLDIKVLIKKGNRSVGRNEAINRSKNEIIAISDAGCILDKKWVQEITNPFKNKKVDVVAGYYKGLASNIFQKCLIPYVLTMDDKINEREFLPATRSTAFRKSVWKKIGGFDETLTHNEDYAFAKKLKKNNAKIVFEKNAIVNWATRKNLKEASIMFFRFAYGDAESGIIRDKVLLIFARYLFYLYLLSLFVLMKSPLLLFLIFLLPILYVLWSINKNYRYVNDHKAFYHLPLLQITSDITILNGTIIGIFKVIRPVKILKMLQNNKIVTLMIIIYSLTVLSCIKWGIPGNNHPFTYHMDEWHQSQAVRSVFKYGSPNLPGSANGSMLHFFYSGILLIPFIIFRIVDPFSIKSAVDSIPVQEKLFIILRLNTLFFGLLSIITFTKIIKYLKINVFLSISLFIFTPAWLMLSNYFKYDIALMFWIVLSLFGFIRYSKSPTFLNFLLAGIPPALAISVKLSAFPIILVYLLSYFIFSKSYIKNLSTVLSGIILNIFIFIFFGIPDIIFGGKNMNEFLYSNLIALPISYNNVLFRQSYLSYLSGQYLPTIYGHVFFIIFIAFLLFMAIDLLINLENRKTYFYKLKAFLFLSFFLFFGSFIPIKFYIGANKGLVLIPFMVLIIGLSLMTIKERYSNFIKKSLFVFVGLLLIIQILESYLWVILKHTISPQEESSLWIEKNIQKNTIIGIENIPLYQFEPDIILKEFYNNVHSSAYPTKYKYYIVSHTSSKLPSVVVISNAELELNYYKKSFKKLLVKRLISEGYRESYIASPNFPFYKFFGNDLNYMNSGLIAYPVSISIFKKK